MLLLTQQHVRPEIPEAGNLPGPAWAGVDPFVHLMQVS